MKQETKDEFFREIYKIVDELVSDMGITSHMTDIYLADLGCFGDETECEEVLAKHGLSDFHSGTPLALLALAKLEGRTMVDFAETPEGETVSINKSLLE